MSIFDYINWVSGYIVNRIESKNINDGNMVFNVMPVRDRKTNVLSYVVEECSNDKTPLRMEFVCENKDKFYDALNTVLIEYFKNSDLLAFTAIDGIEDCKSSLSLVAKNRSSVNLFVEDELDFVMFSEYKKYLDEGTIVKTNSSDNNSEELIPVKKRTINMEKINVVI